MSIHEPVNHGAIGVLGRPSLRASRRAAAHSHKATLLPRSPRLDGVDALFGAKEVACDCAKPAFERATPSRAPVPATVARRLGKVLGL
jgi:hypothetical protein